MKTDRELLDLAAKAAGFPVHIWGNEDRLNCARIDIDLDTKWNPLTDDGDALRLAVSLGIDVLTPDDDQDNASTILPSGESGPCVPCRADRHAATRRAITRAAAAIGEQMP